ncbi:MAG TPA: hypothetical protein VFJ53_06450, partial [Solirubrobacterales bacterium]|nr:hypothetical protein [Solirubrobacterales bacterium]
MAAEYLLAESRANRRETTIELDLSTVVTRIVDVECSLPRGWGTQAWYLPLAFFSKDDVAPNIEVSGCDGEIIPIPTKLQNYAITQRAIRELFASGRLVQPSSAKGLELIDEVIERKPFEASVCRWIFEGVESQNVELLDLLRLLEEYFVLWVPVAGAPLSEHQFRIERRQIHPPDRIFVPRLRYAELEVETAMGPTLIKGELAEGEWPSIRVGALVERLLRALGLRP